MATPTRGARFCGREFTPSEMDLIREVVETCSGLSRMELAQTVCELVRWQRASGGLKARECRGVLGCGRIVWEAVRTEEQRLLFRELVGRHHYLGHAVPFGAHLRYLAYVSRPERAVVGCLQFSSPAWRMAARDAW